MENALLPAAYGGWWTVDGWSAREGAMAGGLIDSETLRRALGAMTFGQGMVLLGRLAGLSDAEMAEAMGLRESDVAWFMSFGRDEVVRSAPEAEVLLDVRGALRDSAAHREMARNWRERLNGSAGCGQARGADHGP